jgi:UDP-glucuronate 4-epimerase
MSRDFTFIDDLVDSVVGLIDHPPPLPEAQSRQRGTLSPVAPFRVVNIGASQPVELERFVDAIEQVIGRKAMRKYLPMQPGDVRRTHADTSELKRILGSSPTTPIDKGVAAFVDWYKSYYRTNAVKPAPATAP